MTPEQPKRIVELDGLRGIAIASVLWQHMVRPYLPENNPLTKWLESITALSWTGVDLFFVLSGFFIGGILMDHRSSPRLWRVFYIRRGLRIVPVYYLVLLVLGLLLHWHVYGAHSFTPLW
ncbi:MAG: acyltransferase family protein, partial [Opitutaceae bacterium]